MTWRPLRVALGITLTPAMSACGDRPPVSDVEVRDSAGIAVVTNRIVDASGAPDVLIATEDLRIGATEGGDSVTFGQIGGIAVDAAGRIYVLDRPAQQVKVYGPDGAFLRFIGRGGEGPGEMSRFPNGILIRGDSALLVMDPPQSRISVFALDGRDLPTLPLPPRPIGQSYALDGAGNLVYRGQTISRAESGGFAFRDVIVRLDLEEPARLDTLMTLDYPASDLGAPGRLRVVLIVNSPFWDRLADGRIAWSSLDRSRVRIHAPDGRLEHIISSDAWVRAPATAADGEAMRELLRAKLISLGGVAEAADGPNVVFPDSFPAITGVRAGPGNTLWVQRMGGVESIDRMAVNSPGPADAFGGGTWDVFDDTGTFLGVVRFPARFRLMALREDAAYGIIRDELDVERVARMRLEPATRPAS